MGKQRMPFDAVKEKLITALNSRKNMAYPAILKQARDFLKRPFPVKEETLRNIKNVATGNPALFGDDVFMSWFTRNMPNSADPDDGILGLISVAYNMKCGYCPVFYFDNPELAEQILESDMNKIPYEFMNPPYPYMYIHLAKKFEYPDGSGDLLDCLFISKGVGGVYENGWEESDNIRVIFVNSDDTGVFTLNWATYPLRGCKDGDVLNFADMETEGRKAMFNALKMICFINSSSSIFETIHRPAKITESSNKKDKYVSQYDIVKFKESGNRYEYDDDTPTGRHLSVRFPVVGHFKHFSKGNMAGRVIWCPPHWKGPLLAPVKTRDYIVEGAQA